VHGQSEFFPFENEPNCSDVREMDDDDDDDNNNDNNNNLCIFTLSVLLALAINRESFPGSGPRYGSWYSDSLWAGRSADGIPVGGGRFSVLIQTGPGAQQPPIQCTPGQSWK
jgi:hypothetical protein